MSVRVSHKSTREQVNRVSTQRPTERTLTHSMMVTRACDDNTSPEDLMEVALNNHNGEYDELLLEHPSLPAAAIELIFDLSERSKNDILFVSHHPNIPQDVLMVLMRDMTWTPQTCTLIASCSNFTERVQKILSDHWHPHVRLDLADSLRASGKILTKLASGTSESVRNAVTLNPSTPPETLLFMITDDNKRVATRVSESLTSRMISGRPRS